MATKQKQKAKRQVATSRGRNWTLDETNTFADILSDVDLNFASTLETKALKRSSNHIVYLDIKKELVSRLKDINESGNSTGEVLIEPLKTDIKSLQKKYNSLKGEWRKISDKAKIGSCLRSIALHRLKHKLYHAGFIFPI